MLAEVANTLWAKRRRAIATAEVADGLYSVIEGLGFSFAPMAQLLDRARAIAVALDLTVYDSFYVSLTERLNLPLVAAHLRIVAAVRKATWPIQLTSIEN